MGASIARLLLGSLLIAGCGRAPLLDEAPDWGGPFGCGKDTDCKGARICVKGECVDPAQDLGVARPLDAATVHDLAAPIDLATSTDGASPDLAALDAAPSDLAPPPDLASPPDLLPGSSFATNYGVDPAHTGAQPGDRVQSPLTQRWNVDLGGPASYPLLAGGRVFIATSGQQPTVRALDPQTGKSLWGPIAGVVVMLAWDQGRLYQLDGSGNLQALDDATGKQIWSTTIQGESFYWSPPTASGGMVYVNGLGEGGVTSAIDGKSGKLVWSQGTFDGSEGTVAVGGGLVFEEESCNQVHAWDTLTGKKLWSIAGNCTGGGGRAPVYYQGKVWARDLFGPGLLLDALTGKTLAQFTSPVLPAFEGGHGLYVSGKTASAVDTNNNVLQWSFAGDGQICTSAVIAGGGGQVFLGSASGNVYEVDEVTGKQISVDNAGTPVTCSSETQAMALASDTLLVPAGNKLVAY